MRIKKLQATIRVKTGMKGDLLQPEERQHRPSLAFAHPQQASAGQTAPPPSQTATEEKSAGEKHESTAAPRSADARAVADRVYDLMKDEVRVMRQRNKPW